MDDLQLEKWKKAGRLAAECLEYGRGLVKEGASLIEVSDKVEQKIFELGGKPAFPVQISFNETAAHNCASPDDKREFKQGDLIKLDVGVHIDGCIGDNAVTINLGDYNELVKASVEARDSAIRISRPGITLAEIGAEIERTIKSYGFNPVKNLSGHGLDAYGVHTHPTIPNFDNKDKFQLKQGQVVAIEPFATTGEGFIYEISEAEVFQLIVRRPVRTGFVRDILRDVEAFEGLPFAVRWLAKKHSANKVNYAMKELTKQGIIRAYPPLVERTKGYVSQSEHSVYVDEKAVVLTKVLD